MEMLIWFVVIIVCIWLWPLTLFFAGLGGIILAFIAFPIIPATMIMLLSASVVMLACNKTYNQNIRVKTMWDKLDTKKGFWTVVTVLSLLIILLPLLFN